MEKNWFSKHVDTVLILSSIIGCFLWMNGKFNEVQKDIWNLEKDISTIKTVLIMKNIMPHELVAQKDGE